jgi:hypothetical protein
MSVKINHLILKISRQANNFNLKSTQARTSPTMLTKPLQLAANTDHLMPNPVRQSLVSIDFIIDLFHGLITAPTVGTIDTIYT